MKKKYNNALLLDDEILILQIVKNILWFDWCRCCRCELGTRSSFWVWNNRSARPSAISWRLMAGNLKRSTSNEKDFLDLIGKPLTVVSTSNVWKRFCRRHFFAHSCHTTTQQKRHKSWNLQKLLRWITFLYTTIGSLPFSTTRAITIMTRTTMAHCNERRRLLSSLPG